MSRIDRYTSSAVQVLEDGGNKPQNYKDITQIAIDRFGLAEQWAEKVAKGGTAPKTPWATMNTKLQASKAIFAQAGAGMYKLTDDYKDHLEMMHAGKRSIPEKIPDPIITKPTIPPSDHPVSEDAIRQVRIDECGAILVHAKKFKVSAEEIIHVRLNNDTDFDAMTASMFKTNAVKSDEEPNRDRIIDNLGAYVCTLSYLEKGIVMERKCTLREFDMPPGTFPNADTSDDEIGAWDLNEDEEFIFKLKDIVKFDRCEE